MNLSIVPYGKYICVWLWLPTVMLLVARILWRGKMSELYMSKGRRDWELLFRASIDYSLLKWTVPKILMFASFYWYATQRSIGVFDFKPPPRLSLRLPLLFLMDNKMLWSKCSNSFVWKEQNESIFWRSIFLYFLTVYFRLICLSNNFKLKVDRRARKCFLHVFCLFF